LRNYLLPVILRNLHPSKTLSYTNKGHDIVFGWKGETEDGELLVFFTNKQKYPLGTLGLLQLENQTKRGVNGEH
jgi:hypothetical protein